MLKQRAYEHIRAKVLAREVAVGDRLSDVALATELGISRTPVREAIGQLASEGLVELVPRFGAFIRMPDRRDVQELYELRELLETFAVSKAVERMSEKDIAELEAICRTMQELMAAARTDRGTGNSDASSLDRTLHYRWIRNDYSFHMRLIQGAGNRWVLKVVSDFHVISTLFSFKKDDPAIDQFSNMAWTFREHMRILRAVRCRDRKMTMHWLGEHIRGGKRKALAWYDWHQQQPDRPAEESMLQTSFVSPASLRNRMSVYGLSTRNEPAKLQE